MFITKLFIERPRMLLMIVIALAIFGVISYQGLPVTLMPDVELPFVTVQTIYPGAGPKEIETLISRPVEDAVSSISGIKQMMSYSLDNVSFVLLEFESYVDEDFAKMDVKDNLDAILAQLPDDAETPVVRSFDIGAENIFELVLVGPQDNRELYEYVDKRMKDRILQKKGVAQLQITGGQERQIHVKFKKHILQNYGISLMQVVGFIGAQNINMPSGYIQKYGSEYTIRLDGEFSSVKQIGELEMPTMFGKQKLKDIANIEDTHADTREISKFYSDELKSSEDLSTITIGIQKTSDANEVETAELVKDEVDLIKKDLPAGMQLFIADDFSLFTRGTQRDTMSTILLGILFTSIILLLFLHDIRSTFIVGLAMPVAIVVTFILINASGFSLNMLSMMGLSVAVGILVTNSIVVIENIYRHANEGEKIKPASLIGTSEIAVAVAATTLTNVVVFLPVANMSGIIGGVFKQFGLTVTYATIVSLGVAFTLTPMLAAHILDSDKIRRLSDPSRLNPLSSFIERTIKSAERAYKNILAYIVGNRGKEIAIIAISILLLLGSLALFPIIGGEFMPYVDNGEMVIEVDMPTNYNIEHTKEVTDLIENRLKKHDEIEKITTRIGTQGGTDIGQNLAKLDIQLIPNDQRDFSTKEFTSEIRKELADIPDASLKIMATSRVGGGPGDAIELFVMGQEQEEVVKYANQITAMAEEIPGAVNVATDYRPGKPEIRLIPNRFKLADMEVNASTVAMELRSALEGMEATKYRELGYEYDIKIRLDEKDRTSPDMIRQIPIATPKGIIPLEQLVDIEYTKAAAKITRVDKYNTVTVTMGTEGASSQEVLGQIMEKAEKIDLPNGYKVEVGGQAEMMQDSFRSMGEALILAILLTYMLLVSFLESFMQPLIIFFTIPLSLIGVLLALFLTGNTFNMITIMSFIMLVGIVVNNAILLIDYTNVLRNKGQETKDALVNACPVKLKPIVMSTLAIMLGMLPLALGIGAEGVEMRQSMGIVTIAGLIASAIFTMLVIPILYRWFSPKLND
ncbi:MAG: efflux RND transporter permease subunit [Candidatus Zixiibacteriota bacterium]